MNADSKTAVVFRRKGEKRDHEYEERQYGNVSMGTSVWEQYGNSMGTVWEQYGNVSMGNAAGSIGPVSIDTEPTRAFRGIRSVWFPKPTDGLGYTPRIRGS
jgi:hypothetical protein